MKQILQNLENGATMILETPRPNAGRGRVVIDTSFSLVSSGTERMLVDFARASYIEKALQQPERVKQVLDKIATDGISTTLEAVTSKLKEPMPLGYCNVGLVTELGPGTEGFKIGDRVLSNGPHAEVVSVPANLCAKIPAAVADETAVFGVLASIGLQGIRLATPSMGEAVAVIGAGLIGLLTIQMLRACGCRVLAIDHNSERLALAEGYGAETYNLSKSDDPVHYGIAFSRGRGIDAALITASTKSSDPVSQAARMCRKRGRIVMVGVTGLELNRSEFYEKELTFQVSCSYGPGRYDPTYEEKGLDYPIGFVRWTEKRNFEAVLDLMEQGKLETSKLVSHVYEADEAPSAYACLTEDPKALGILLKFSSAPEARQNRRIELPANISHPSAAPSIALIGAGNYASRKLIPALKEAGARLISIGTTSGLGGVVHGTKAGFQEATTDIDAVFTDPRVDTIVIATRHDSHAEYARRALNAGKNAFIEKPLAMNLQELAGIEEAYRASREKALGPLLMIGFNRRFSRLVVRMMRMLKACPQPKMVVAMINAGSIPAKHWTQALNVGGGRIIGEACHFIDLLRHLVDSPIVSIQARKMGENPYEEVTEDKATITLGFADGSLGTIHDFANGSMSFPKERIEVFVDGKILQLDNFRVLRGFGWPGFRRMRLMSQDKGQKACVAAFLDAIRRGQEAPIPVEEIFEVSRATIEAARILREQ